jgi:NAD(P)-dependent dehydrogenase (short-subunit alcohol dehydrogenase family)
MMDLGLHHKRALILGSSSGMGRAIAAGLAAEGARVVVTGRDEERVAAAAGEIGASGSVVADLTDQGGPEHVVSAALDALGGLDIFVGNTGGGKPGGLVTGGFDAVDAGYRRMLLPQLKAAQAAIPPLRDSGAGRMVFLTARSVLEASPDLALSSVFRSGVAAAARSLALELAPKVTVNVVVPGQFDTGALERFEAAKAADENRTVDEVRASHLAAIPMRRLGRAEELADLVVFLVGSRAGYITGATFRIDGGSTRGF